MKEAGRTPKQPASRDRAPRMETPSKFPPQLYLVQPNGFCAGIVRTIRGTAMMEQLYPDEPRYLVGTPAHNATVIAAAENAGWQLVETIEQVPPGAKAALGPHGSTEQDLRIAREKELTFIDTICPLVVDVQLGVREALRTEDATVIVWGKKGHAETRAHTEVDPEEFDEEARKRLLLGTTPEQILSDEFIAGIKDKSKVAFYAQTTHNADEAIKLKKDLEEKLGVPVTSLKTEGICFATSDRQQGVKVQAQMSAEKGESLYWIVVGDETSSNSQELFKLATQHGASGTFVLNAEMLSGQESKFVGYDAIAVTAGASAPQQDIDGVLAWCMTNGSNPAQVVQAGRDESGINFKAPTLQEPGKYVDYFAKNRRQQTPNQ